MNKISIKVANSNKDFVGIECQNNLMQITFPIGYDIDSKIIGVQDTLNLKKYQNDILLLLKILEKNKDNSNFNYGSYNFNFTAGIYLINDYFENGLVKSYEFQDNTLDIGTVNWNKTIHSKIPGYYKGNFIYFERVSKNLMLENDEITEIQLFCLHKAFLILGIFYHNYKIDFYKPLNKKDILYKIQKKLNKTNIDKDRQRLNIMRKFIEGTDIDMIGDKEIKIGTYYFNLVWQNLLTEEIKTFHKELSILPNAYYITSSGDRITSSLKPDLVISTLDIIYLIDAKYYRISELPQTSDIIKQLFYADFINAKIKNKKIKNIFLLPNKVSNQIVYYGYGTSDSHKNANGGLIDTYYLDTKSILEGNINIIECINDLVDH